ncbi:hypothetical protein [Nafulsella turpanensis]|uniref:hypothetical protein n=1 Tax=Nafulsella turpanensis TaxID=1265690 RepID=UPI000369CA89|nr:hypothetical protein [Nafulsella turpanensis]
MNNTLNAGNIFSGVFSVVMAVTGILNMILVHPVPGIIYLLLAIFYLPATNGWLSKKFNFPIPAVVKIILGIIIIMFTLGVSDLGDMIDKL